MSEGFQHPSDIFRLNCFTNSIFNHTGTYYYAQGKILIHLRYEYESNKNCTTPGSYLRYHRKFQGMTTRQFAEKVGIVPATLGLYEDDRNRIKYDTVVAISRGLNINRNRLLNEYRSFGSRLF